MIETAGDRFRAVLERVEFRGWRFNVGASGAIEGATAATYYLQVEFDAEDFGSPGSLQEPQQGRKWILSRHMTDGEIVQTALKAVLSALEHEAREEFLYKGHPIFGPHYDLDVLVAVCETGHGDARRAPTGDAESWLRGQDHDGLLEGTALDRQAFDEKNGPGAYDRGLAAIRGLETPTEKDPYRDDRARRLDR